MNPDPSNNLLYRRTNSGGGVGGVGGVGGDERNRDDFYERFHINQYYNAVEDEQIYMDEYTTLLHRYNDFIVNGNAMFSRMEQTLRENLTRSIARQTFYYYRFDELRRARGIQVAPSVGQFISAPVPVHAPAGPSVPAPPAGPAPPAAPAAPAAPARRLADVFPRLLSRYFHSELSRNEREPTNQGLDNNNNTNNNTNNNNNIFSMLYTIPLEVRTNGGAAAPTRDQINRATMNTLFSHIISPVNATCPISRDEFSDESEITLIRGCNHIFNRSSLREWFVSHSTCPMCRSDIREYQPPAANPPPPPPSQSSAAASSLPPRTPANLSIDSVDENHMTFSYDMPLNYDNNQIYQDIVNTMNQMTNTINNSSHHAQYHYDDADGDDDDDIMEVD